MSDTAFEWTSSGRERKRGLSLGNILVPYMDECTLGFPNSNNSSSMLYNFIFHFIPQPLSAPLILSSYGHLMHIKMGLSHVSIGRTVQVVGGVGTGAGEESLQSGSQCRMTCSVCPFIRVGVVDSRKVGGDGCCWTKEEGALPKTD